MVAKTRQLRMNTGSEGPSWDPYHYTERTMVTDDTTITLHTGLAEWIEVNGEREVPPALRCDFREMWIQDRFQQLTELTIPQFDRAYYHIKNTCPNCKQLVDTYAIEGYPGETMNLCCICRDVVSCDFNRSAIE